MHELSDEGASPQSSNAAPASSLPYGEAAYGEAALPYGEAAYGEAAEAADGDSPLGAGAPFEYPTFAASPGSVPTQEGFQARPSLPVPLARLDRPSLCPALPMTHAFLAPSQQESGEDDVHTTAL